MTELISISQEAIKDMRLTGLDDTPGFSTIAMQTRFDAHPDKNTEVINNNAVIQNQNNAELIKRLSDAEKELLNKQNMEEGKVLSSNDFTDSEKDKLLNIEEKSNHYVLPVSDVNTLGGVKKGEGIEISPEGIISAKNHEERIKNAENALLNRVEKVEGKGLSSCDFTIEEKTKLLNIAENANNFVLASAAGDKLGGVKAEAKSELHDVEVKIDSATGKLYISSAEVIGKIPNGDEMNF